ncbi:MAG TPA: TorF family putative porin [Gammaproteobacteria bacterium]|nr:TorF family putative porin [Gammaproteobacteria bacterium]
MHKRILTAFLFAACGLSAAAHADDGMGDQASPAPAAAPELVGGNVQFMTNYVGRGLAQSLGNPSVEGEIDVNTGDGWYGGVDGNSINWIDKLYPGDDVGTEIDAWAGYRMHFGGGDWRYKLGFLRLQFPGNYAPQTPPTAEPNTTEAYGSLSWTTYSVQVNYSVTESFGTPDTKGSLYIDLSGSQPLGNGFTLGEHLGRNQKTGHDPVTGLSHSRNDYTDYKLHLDYVLGQGITLTLAHTWTNGDLSIYTLGGYAVAGHHTWLLIEKDF